MGSHPSWTLPLRPLSGRESLALAEYNRDVARGVQHPAKVRHFYAVQQWRWNVEEREAMLDQGAHALPGGGYLWVGDGVPPTVLYRSPGGVDVGLTDG